jgi:hypothetical protein
MEIDTALSLEALEREYWQKLEVYPSRLVENCHRFRKIPLQDLTTEQIRILISQQIGLNFLIPLACNELEKNILAEGDLYAGDLLEVVLRTDKRFWLTHLDLLERLRDLLKNNLNAIEDPRILKISRSFLEDNVRS